MKALTLSLGLALMSVAAVAAPAGQRTALFCGPGRLDLACRPAAAPSWRVAPLDARHADQAYVLKFGGPGRAAGEPDWVVSFGNIARQVLFWAAVASIL